MGKQAVLLLAHGTPETVEQIPEYLRNVVSGRPLPQSVIEEIQHRYSLIGKSPLTEITMEQGRLVRWRGRRYLHGSAKLAHQRRSLPQSSRSRSIGNADRFHLRLVRSSAPG